MLKLGAFETNTCGGLSRRAFLQASAALPLAGGLTEQVLAAPRGNARAKSILFLWLWGAPSHLDTFDPKPDAPAEYRGPFDTIATRTPGLRFTELLPRLAARSQAFSIVKSHVTFAGGHPDAGTYGLTGFAEKPEPVQPAFGAIVAKHRGHRGQLPPFVSVGPGIPRDVVRIIDGYGGGKLGKSFDPFMVNCSDTGETGTPALKLLAELAPHRVQDRRRLLTVLDDARRELDHAAETQWDQSYQQAYSLLMRPEARRALDLTSERPSVRAAYGQTAFGQSCLLARRLVEAEVPFIQVNWSQFVECMTPNCDIGWDTHIYNFELLQDRHCPIFDRAMSALLDDLQQRGLLATTLVVAIGEFGRTPRINGRAARDHWPRCYSSLWAGAGLPGGRVIGQSDARGEDPLTEPITPLMVGATIAELAGMDTQARAEMNVLDGGKAIHEFVA